MSGRRWFRALVVAAVAVVASLCPATFAAAERTPSRLLVTASEWRFVLSKGKIRGGPAIVQLYNSGEDPHNLRIRRASGGAVRRIGQLDPGEAGSVQLRLGRGKRYRLWCSLPQHRDRGMKATLKVARKRR
jgi:hypothetical protein